MAGWNCGDVTRSDNRVVQISLIGMVQQLLQWSAVCLSHVEENVKRDLAIAVLDLVSCDSVTPTSGDTCCGVQRCSSITAFVLFASGDAGGAGARHSRFSRAPGSHYDTAVHASQPECHRERDPTAGCLRNPPESWRHSGDGGSGIRYLQCLV